MVTVGRVLSRVTVLSKLVEARLKLPAKSLTVEAGTAADTVKPFEIILPTAILKLTLLRAVIVILAVETFAVEPASDTYEGMKRAIGSSNTTAGSTQVEGEKISNFSLGTDNNSGAIFGPSGALRLSLYF